MRFDMGRKSKLKENQWHEILNRHLQGEKIRPLAREFQISEAAIRQQISTQSKQIKTVAQQIVIVEENFQALSVTSQISALKLVDQIKAVTENLTGAGGNGALTAKLLSKIASHQVDKIDPGGTMEANGDVLQSILALTKTANEASMIGLNLLKIHKPIIEEINKPEVQNIPSGLGFLYNMPDDPVEASRSYQRLITESWCNPRKD
jgi:hypothetical protein